MNIFVLIVTLGLNYFANKAKQMRMLLALAVAIALNEFSPLSPLFLKAVKVRLPRLEGPPLVAHVLPQVVAAAECSSLAGNCKEPKLREH